MRKSFIVHHDSLEVLNDLTDEQAGQLFKAIKAYQLGEKIELNPLVKVALSPFKNQFKRDAEKYEKLCEKNRQIAVNRHKNQSTKSTTGNHSLPQATKSTDNDSKSDSKSKSDSNKPIDQSEIDREFEQIWCLYGKKGNKKTSKAKFIKLCKTKKQTLKTHIPKYVTATPDKQFRKNLETYINQEAWNDEIITRGQSVGFIEEHTNGDWRNGL